MRWRRSFSVSGQEKQWFRQTVDITSLIEPGATTIQVALQCEDRFSTADPCHSHAPLIDNVRIVRTFDPATGIGDVTPSRAVLYQNHPNPFNPATTIRYSITSPSHVSLRVYSVSGMLVRTLVDEFQSSQQGNLAALWDGRDENGSPVSSGIYFYRLHVAGSTHVKKMVLLK